MQDFEYCRARTLAEAVRWLAEGLDSRVLAGGQSLLPAMRLGLAQPERLVDVSALLELQGLATQDRALHVGAMCRHAQIARAEPVAAFAPGLAALAAGIADEQVRQLGTLGGSLAQADPAACWPAGMLALGATLVTDRRRIAVDDFFTGFYATALEPGELLCRIEIPRPQAFGYLKFEQPASRFAMVGAAVARFDDGVRVALAGTAGGALRLPAHEAALSRRFTPEALQDLNVDEALMAGDLHADADYRAHLAAVAVRRVVARLLAPAAGGRRGLDAEA